MALVYAGGRCPCAGSLSLLIPGPGKILGVLPCRCGDAASSWSCGLHPSEVPVPPRPSGSSSSSCPAALFNGTSPRAPSDEARSLFFPSGFPLFALPSAGLVFRPHFLGSPASLLFPAYPLVASAPRPFLLHLSLCLLSSFLFSVLIGTFSYLRSPACSLDPLSKGRPSTLRDGVYGKCGGEGMEEEER